MNSEKAYKIHRDRLDRWVTIFRGAMIDCGIDETEYENSQVLLWALPIMVTANEHWKPIMYCPTNEQQLDHLSLQLSALEPTDEMFDL